MSKRTRSSSELQIRNSLLRTTENRGQSRISSLQRRARLILQTAEYLPHEFESDPDFLAEEAQNVERGIKRSLRCCREISTLTLIFSHARTDDAAENRRLTRIPAEHITSTLLSNALSH